MFRKMFALCVALVMMVAVAACSSSGTDMSESEYVGTWECTSYVAQGTTISPDEVGTSTLEFKADGTASYDLIGQTGETDWTETETGVEITDASGTVTLTKQDATLVLEQDGVQFIFEKQQ